MGRKRKIKKESEIEYYDPEAEEKSEETEVKEVESPEPEPRGDKDNFSQDQSIMESRTVLNTTLDPGMAFFESPEGFVIIAEDSRDRVWCGKANKGKGCWINKRR